MFEVLLNLIHNNKELMILSLHDKGKGIGIGRRSASLYFHCHPGNDTVKKSMCKNSSKLSVNI